MERKRKFSILHSLMILCALAAAALSLAACGGSGEHSAVKGTVDFNLPGLAAATFETEEGANLNDALASVQKPIIEYEFDGYYLNGEKVTPDTKAPGSDFTVEAHWLVSYSEEHWLEQADGNFAKDNSLTRSLKAALGAQVTVEARTIQGYTAAPDATGAVLTATLDKSGIVLKMYYTLNSYTLTFDKGFASAATGDMQPMVAKFGKEIALPECGYTSATATFIGYNTAADNSGKLYKAGENFTLMSNTTLYCIWEAPVTQTVYVEKDDNSDTFEQGDDITFNAVVGSTASCRNPDATKYSACEHAGAIQSAIVQESGLALIGYFELRTFTVTYEDDGTTERIAWGQTLTVRTPANDDPKQEILSYSTSRSGNGREYVFGSQIQIKEDITLYPVVADIYQDDAGSGDIVKIRRNMTGLGAVTLVRGGNEYSGFVNVDEETGIIEFEVTVSDRETAYGRLYIDPETDEQLFRYRGEEAGTYLLLDPLYYDPATEEYGIVYGNYLLALDGYGTGVLAMPEDGTERVENYYCQYEYEEATEDYYLLGVFPATGNQVEFYFRLIEEPTDIGEGMTVDGYFMQYGTEEGEYFYFYNREIDDSQVLYLDGYGNGTLYAVSADPDTGNYVGDPITDGIYFYADYFDEDNPELVFLPRSGDPFYFILQTVSAGEGQSVAIFLIRHNEQGDYTRGSGDPSTLYLDGYGGAYYSPDGTAESELAGFYTIEPVDGSEGKFIVIIEFLQDGGRLALEIDIGSKAFSIFDDGFVIENGVLTRYLGMNTAIEIPEGVTEIAAGVFANVDLTSVTFPATLEKIGDYAFENSSVSGGSMLKTVVFKSTTPPTLGEDVFRWIKGNFKIFVPDGLEETYRAAFSTATASQPSGYAQFVTSQREQANKPEFEVKDGVLVSYNNKDEDPQNVHIRIPDGVTSIADGVFAGTDYIVSVDLNGVTSIGKDAFRGCKNLASVTFNQTMDYIGESAFYECALEKISLGSVGEIAELAFARNFSLVDVTFSGTVGTIGARAFLECGRITDEQETEVTPLEFVITFHGETPPTLVGLVFDGVLMLRVYVDSYEAGMSFAGTEGDGWARYVSALRVKAASEEKWYNKAAPAEVLEIGDRIMFNETYFGLYKRTQTGFEVCWFEWSSFAQTLTLIENRITLQSDGTLTGFDLSDAGNTNSYVFVKEGTTLSYRNASTGETLEVTFGSTAGKFSGKDIVFDYSNFRTRFDHEGYTYTVTFYNDLTFTYTRSKIVVEKSYTAADGSDITIYEGDMITANGHLKDVDGITGPNGNGLETTTQGWYLTKVNENMYTVRISWRSDTYIVTIRIESETTFSYTWEKAASIVTYTDAEGNVAVITKQKDGSISSIHILFKTANGSEEVIASFEKVSENVYTIFVDATVEETDENGNTSTVPSEFNGTYTLTFNEEDKTFTLVRA